MQQEAKTRNFVRIRKGEIKAETWVQPEGIDECLECWKLWMKGDVDKDLGIKTMRGLTGEDDGYGRDSSEQQQARDTRIAVATDAMIDSLPRIYVWAIYQTFGIGTVWRFPNADLISRYLEARIDLEMRLRKNFVTSVLF